jgi:hypothetical protein
MKPQRSCLERQAAGALRRMTRLPIGPDRNDFRQLAAGLFWHRHGTDALVEGRLRAIRHARISVSDSSADQETISAKLRSFSRAEVSRGLSSHCFILECRPSDFAERFVRLLSPGKVLDL